ncbi:MAG: hypothetical protein GKR91_09565 [Pseudomonadales bacterium]|nr:hypothetical protein [Pseudomonadales bacterium]
MIFKTVSDPFSFKSRTKTEFFAQSSGQFEESDVSPLLPVLDAFGSVRLGSKTTLVAEAQIFRMDFNNYDGTLNYIRAELQYDLGAFALGLGYSFYGMKLRSNKDSLSGEIEFRHNGPSISAAFRF